MPRPERTIKGFPGHRTAYPELRALGYASVPDFRERTPWGSSSPGQYREAGLPNITGSFGYQNDFGSIADGGQRVYPTGCFSLGQRKPNRVDGSTGTGSFDINFNAALSSPVYGRSSTVQPAAYTVRFLIRAAS